MCIARAASRFSRAEVGVTEESRRRKKELCSKEEQKMKTVSDQ